MRSIWVIQITVADIEKAAAGAAVTQGLAIHGSEVDHAGAMIERWV